VSRSVGRRLRAVLWVWDAILLGAGLLYPFVPDPEPLVTIMNIQLVVTILGSLLAVLLSLGSMPRNDLRRSVVLFLVVSGAFLVLLVVDILISRVGISSLAFLDNTSLPIYLLALNIGSFLFAGRFLNADPLLDGGRVTETCRRNYSLTSRESEIIERLLDGKTNQELADALFISRKTVENHLYNIYQKMDVKNRVQMIGTLRNWNRVEWE
jgi:DNA-binding CsgD family transcriptional regulator